MISISTALPAAKVSAAGSAGKATIAKNSLRELYASDETSGTFASLFGRQTATLTASAQTSPASNSTESDVLAQLTAQLKNGTPMATIVDQIAQSIGSAAAKQLAGKYSQSDLDRMKTSITQTVAKALSPPSNAPPGTAAEQAAALAARLQQMVESLARDAENGAGQQNELSGTRLDADSAKDNPAQQKTSETSSTATSKLDVSSVVQSLLSQALASLASPNSSTAKSASTTQIAQVAQAAAVSTIATQAAVTPQNPIGTTAAGSRPQYVPASASTSPVPSGTIGMSNAPDLLARMLVRAAGADASVNAASDSASATGGQAGQSPQPSPTALAARFAALLAEDTTSTIASGSSSGNAAQNDASTSGNTAQHAFGQTPSLATSLTNGNSVAAGVASPGGMLSQVQSALSGSSSPASTVDANAVIEQLVKGMVMRTAADGTSEIRLQLQPQNLGTVTMKLSVSGNSVNATVIAQNADVRSTIAANQNQLARSLESAGLTLSGFSVDVSGGDSGNQPKDQTAGFGRRYTVHEIGGQSASESTEEPSSGPPLLGNSSLDLFNYLA